MSTILKNIGVTKDGTGIHITYANEKFQDEQVVDIPWSLIEAAPELLAALKNCVAHIKNGGMGITHGPIKSSLKQAESAIAKALGAEGRTA